MCVHVELDRSAHVPLAGEQTGDGPVWSSETTGFCLQTLPEVLSCYKTLSLPHEIKSQAERRGSFATEGLQVCGCAGEFFWIFSAFLFFSSLLFPLGSGGRGGCYGEGAGASIPAASYVGVEVTSSRVPRAWPSPPLLSLCCPKKADEWSEIFPHVPASSECSVVLSLPLPAVPWTEGARAGLMEVLLEEWLLRPLQSLASIRPVAEFYRLKRKMMDGPFRRETATV